MGPVLCTPLLVERAALRGARVPVRRTGMGRRRAGAAAASLQPGTPVLVAGLARGEAPGMRAGDVVVATEVRGPGREPLPVPSAPLLAAALRRLGLTVHVGPIRSAPGLVGGPATGEAIAVDMESAWLSVQGPFAVVRVVVDSAEHPLPRAGTPARGLRALRALRACTPALEEWAAASRRTDGATPCAASTSRAPGGTSSTSSTNTAPRAARSRTTWALCTIWRRT